MHQPNTVLDNKLVDVDSSLMDAYIFMHKHDCYSLLRVYMSWIHILTWLPFAPFHFSFSLFIYYAYLSRCWRLFMIKLWNHNLLDASTMNNCNIILQSYQEECSDPMQSWLHCLVLREGPAENKYGILCWSIIFFTEYNHSFYRDGMRFSFNCIPASYIYTHPVRFGFWFWVYCFCILYA